MGYFFIEHIIEHDTFLTPSGVGRVKEIEISLSRSPYPPNLEAAVMAQYYSLNATNSVPQTPGAVAPLNNFAGVNLYDPAFGPQSVQTSPPIVPVDVASPPPSGFNTLPNALPLPILAP
jgi:hypothetical protein